MNVLTDSFNISTSGKGTYEITQEVNSIVSKSSITNGLVTVFVRHTSCSLIVMENADYSARSGLHAFFGHLVPEDTPYFVHTYEGSDDMPSHIRMCLTDVDKNVPIMNGEMVLGTWQGLFLFEHRRAPHKRHIAVSVCGQ